MSDIEHNTAEYYLFDLGSLIKERARIAKKESMNRSPRDEFTSGRLMGYHEVISPMQEQAFAFGLPLEKLNLHDIDPEKELL